MITKKGINASPGVAIGPVLVLDTEEYRIPHRTIEASQLAGQIRNLDAALEASRQEVVDLRAAAARKLGDKTAVIFEFHEQFISDPKLRESVTELINGRHWTAAYAFGQVMNGRQRMFRNVADPYLKERVRDLFDIERRVLRHILGRAREDMTRLTEPVINCRQRHHAVAGHLLRQASDPRVRDERRRPNVAYGDHRPHVGDSRGRRAQRHYQRTSQVARRRSLTAPTGS